MANHYSKVSGFTDWALGVCEDFEAMLGTIGFEREHGLYWLNRYMITAHDEFDVPGDACLRIIAAYMKDSKVALSELRHLANYGW